jgi:hypothetical protein
MRGERRAAQGSTTRAAGRLGRFPAYPAECVPVRRRPGRALALIIRSMAHLQHIRRIASSDDDKSGEDGRPAARHNSRDAGRATAGPSRGGAACIRTSRPRRSASFRCLPNLTARAGAAAAWAAAVAAGGRAHARPSESPRGIRCASRESCEPATIKPHATGSLPIKNMNYSDSGRGPSRRCAEERAPRPRRPAKPTILAPTRQPESAATHHASSCVNGVAMLISSSISILILPQRRARRVREAAERGSRRRRRRDEAGALRRELRARGGDPARSRSAKRGGSVVRTLTRCAAQGCTRVRRKMW